MGDRGNSPEYRGAPEIASGRISMSSRELDRRRVLHRLRQANGLLGALSEAVVEPLIDHLKPVSFPAGALLVEPLKAITTVYFPLEGLNSVVLHLMDGSSAEVTMGGRRGMVGVAILSGGDQEETETRAQTAGSALSLSSGNLREALAAHADLRGALSWFAPLLLSQISLSAACNARHTINQRLARWLLTASDTVGGHKLDLGQDRIAQSLGIRRPGVSEALRRLSDTGLLMTSRNRITIRDKARLEAQSCECYREGEAIWARHAPARTADGGPNPAEIQSLSHRHAELTV